MLSFNLQRPKSMKLAVAGLMTMTVLLSACGNNNAANSGAAATAAPAAETTAAPTTAPAETAAPAAEQTVTDAMGHKVTIPANPQRVLASYMEDYLVALGVTPVAQWSVANGIQEYLATQLKDIPTISYDLPLEAVTSFAPDFTIVQSEGLVQNGLYDQLNKIAPTYVLGDEVSKDWRASLLRIGELLGKTPEAEKALADYDQKAADAKAKITASIGDQSVAILWLVSKNFFIVDETRSSGAVLYGDLGLKLPNLVTDIPAESRATWNPITLEKLSELTADQIILVNSDGADAAEITDGAIWKGIPAVKAGNVHEFGRESSWLYSGPVANSKTIDDALSSLVK
ncbi:iron-hydroxamate ABC transporter substrate-binding protein [Paenibacillus sp. MMS20-IR301]|uniref:iron-hydroxamate ABC transporter substrate-binding protein n=1 Tax=Paenibacillus sp. MMS20-IR301 TaxID=2895946 RepID=UPI0028F13883|nr:iron-hydroxamate ABC transporter substrate-binding protein [Paenibacillus sp. MMS20-IR301]WNS45072.1 iron-hydroxamate ABC transporter substrate-binding protein [Paenibacillus sp. MMS20-IR301]